MKDKDSDVLSRLADIAGHTLYTISLRSLRWMRIPVLLFGISALLFGLWNIFHGNPLGFIIAVCGALVMFMNLATWSLVGKFTEIKGGSHRSF